MKILLTDGRLLQHPALEDLLKDLMKDGHTVDVRDELSGYTFVAGSNCWYLIPEVSNLFRGALSVRRERENQERAVQPPTQAAAKRKPAKGNRGSGKDTGARKAKRQSAASS